MSTALTVIKGVYRFASKHYVAINTVTKYPILLSSLIERIRYLAKQHQLLSDILHSEHDLKVFDLSKGKAAARSALKGLGGIYILHNKTTGLFYLGSALRYFHDNGRLHDYFMSSRVKASLAKESTKVSYDLAHLIFKHGIEDFTLLVIPMPTITSEAALKELEQL